MPWDRARHFIRGGDLVLVRRPRSVIATAGRGEHSHAAKAIFWSSVLYLLEVREWYGGRLVNAEREIHFRQAIWDIYSPNADDRWPNYELFGSVDAMRELIGVPYGWWNLAATACLHLPGLRFFVKPELRDDQISKRPPYCSQAVAWAERTGGGVDPVPHLADSWTEPSDLARSTFYKHRFAVCPNLQGETRR